MFTMWNDGIFWGSGVDPLNDGEPVVGHRKDVRLNRISHGPVIP